jgi:uncharacterized protein with FMN-binding domain
MKKKANRTKKRRIWIVLLVIFGVIVVGIGGAILLTEPGRQEIRNLVIDSIDFTELQDGIYVGEFKGTRDSFRNTKVQVTVASGEVVEITVLQGVLDKQGKPVKMIGGLSVDDLSDRVLSKQTLQVDIISGATLSSKAHLEAVENAIEQAVQ